MSDISEATTELRILRHIVEVAPEEESQYITRLLDEFEHRGPNGLHKCLVFPPMGPSVNTMVDELPQFNPRKLGMKVRYPPQMAKSILNCWLCHFSTNMVLPMETSSRETYSSLSMISTRPLRTCSWKTMMYRPKLSRPRYRGWTANQINVLLNIFALRSHWCLSLATPKD